MNNPDGVRRGLVFGAAATVALAAAALGQASAVTQADTAPKELDGKPMPEPWPAQSAGPVAPGRGSNLSGKVARVTGAGAASAGRSRSNSPPTAPMLWRSTLREI